MRIHLLIALSLFSFSQMQANAQGYQTNNPNLKNFYMGRQEWQYIDTNPVVTGQPGEAGQAGQAGQGAMPSGPPPLPRAGFTPYSSSIPSVRDALPKVNNGVPKPVPQPKIPSGMRGKANNMQPRQPAVQTVKTYTPYKGYGGYGAPASTGKGTSTSTNVKGSVLDRSRPRPNNY